MSSTASNRSEPVVARKRFGQHFLSDRSVVAAIVSAIRPEPGQRIVEIGPGTGVLSRPLLAATGSLDVIEIDRDLAARLRRTGTDSGMRVHEGDVLRFDWSSLEGDAPLRIVGNLPYNISSPLLLALIAIAPRVQDQHFMLQKEVVDRMVAGPGSHSGRLSIMLQCHYEMDSLFDVPPESFDPPPRVDSSVVRMIPRARPLTAQVDLLEKIVAAAFVQRRKMLRNTLGPWLAAHAPRLRLDVEAGSRPELGVFEGLQRRPEEIAVESWCALADVVSAYERSISSIL